MKIVFRVDASIEMGTGHVMRCLTLANALSASGVQSTFICREHQGNLIDFIRDHGHQTIAIPMSQEADNKLAHGEWLGATQLQDVEACTPILASTKPDWVIVDHYGLNAEWEKKLKPYFGKHMVIDDLADRYHDCDVLIDQTFGRDTADYKVYVPKTCHLLCGAQYALLRPEFNALRPSSLNRRQVAQKARRILVTLGGADKDNYTTKVLNALHHADLSNDCEILVVMGATAPWVKAVQQAAKNMPWPTKVLSGANNMAELMLESDLAIGAAGSTSWERCCLGLPSVTIVIAQNQSKVSMGLQQARATLLYQPSTNFCAELSEIVSNVANNPTLLSSMSKAAAGITDGTGVLRVSSLLLDFEETQH